MALTLLTVLTANLDSSNRDCFQQIKYISFGEKMSSNNLIFFSEKI
jgi:hypothetical protein